MGSDCVAVVPPLFDQDLGFEECVENFAIEQFFSEPRIEAFKRTALSRRS
jgi:hypothetical protein